MHDLVCPYLIPILCVRVRLCICICMRRVRVRVRVDAMNIDPRVEHRGWSDQIIVTKGGISRQQPLPYSPASFTKVLSVDAAYHFSSRAWFFHDTARLLVPGGTLALADLVLGAPLTTLNWRTRTMLRLVGTLSGIPVENMVCASEYKAQLEHEGFRGVKVCMHVL